MGLVKAYLFMYNVAQVFGWGSLLYRSLPFIQDQIKATNGLFPARHSKTFYPLIDDHLKLVQTAALLEVIHAVLGFVRSNPVITAVQIMRFDLFLLLFVSLLYVIFSQYLLKLTHFMFHFRLLTVT